LIRNLRSARLWKIRCPPLGKEAMQITIEYCGV